MTKKQSLLIISLLCAVLLCGTRSHAEETNDPEINIAVMDIKAVGMSSSESLAFTEFLRDGFINSSYFKVLPRENMDAILQEQALQQSGCTSDECAIQLGKIFISFIPTILDFNAVYGCLTEKNIFDFTKGNFHYFSICLRRIIAINNPKNVQSRCVELEITEQDYHI